MCLIMKKSDEKENELKLYSFDCVSMGILKISRLPKCRNFLAIPLPMCA